MSIDEAKRVFVPFGSFKGKTVGYMLAENPREYVRLSRYRGLYGKIKEAIETLRMDPDVQKLLARPQRTKKNRKETPSISRQIDLWWQR